MIAVSFREKLIAAGQSSGTDKVDNHHYEDSYWRLLQDFEDIDDLSLLEIGYGSGSGIKFWRDVFPDAFIYCLDRDLELQEKNVKVIKADQSNLDSLRTVIDQINRPISIIVDDGSHHPSHQLLTFSAFFRDLLAPQGIYIIEDIETSFWRRGSIYGYEFSYGLHDPWSLIEAFKVAVDYVNRLYLSEQDKSLLEFKMMSVGLDPSAVMQVDSLFFAQNIVAASKNLGELLPANQSYVFSQFTERFPITE
jgi:hypothetical protein